jgi:L,D-peptidoglycan transpeptidase YkuD (ErfK/YbiS/YcfS/YnhG family)
LQRYEREGIDTPWRACGAAVPVSLGRSGMAWGRGLHPLFGGLQKREGDGCTPAGVFAITTLFGNDSRANSFSHSAKFPYLLATPDLKAIDDPASAHYNRIIDQTAVAQPDWMSCEDMLRSDGRYDIGAVVAHNADPSLPGAGSCIFLHVWERDGAPTAGCAAMALVDMVALANWLDAAATPVLIQLPQAEYADLSEAWGLPPFPA